MELRTEIEIDAPAEEVWRILTDFASYPEWNPFIVMAQGKLSVGEHLIVTVGSAEGRQVTFKPRLVLFEPLRELRWIGHLFLKGLFDGEHFFLLNSTASGGTRLIQGENFGGILLKFMGGRLTDTARGFVGMNAALKRRVERSVK